MNPDNAPTNSNAGAQPAPAAAPKAAEASWYTSNPFLISTKGLVMILQHNPVPALAAMFVALLLGAGIFALMGILSVLIGDALGVVGTLALFAALLVWFAVFVGSYIAIAAASARDEKIKTMEAFSRSFAKVIPLLMLFVLLAILLGVGFLLLIVPGIYLLGRTALSAVAMFEENLGPVAAIKRSFELTKGHVLEMIGAMFAGSFMCSQGLLSGATGIAPLVGRYHELKKLKESGAAKPKMHWLNWFLPLITVALFGLYMWWTVTQVNSATNKLKSNDTTSPFDSNYDDLFKDSDFNTNFDTDFNMDDTSPDSEFNFE